MFYTGSNITTWLFYYKQANSMNIDRLVFAIAGSFILLSIALSQLHSEYWLFFTGFVGLGVWRQNRLCVQLRVRLEERDRSVPPKHFKLWRKITRQGNKAYVYWPSLLGVLCHVFSFLHYLYS